MSTAAATLTRAAEFWWQRSRRLGDGWHESDSAVHARYLANGFRELDGFLRLLLDEVAPVPAARRRNTANRLGALETGAADGRRLRAIGRSAACLFHCAGWVRRPDLPAGGWMTAGWPDRDGDDLRRYSLGDRLRPDGGEVADVCAFFLRVGESVRG